MLYQLSYRPKIEKRVNKFNQSIGRKQAEIATSMSEWIEKGRLRKHRGLDFSNGKVEAMRVVEQQVADDFDHRIGITLKLAADGQGP